MYNIRTRSATANFQTLYSLNEPLTINPVPYLVGNSCLPAFVFLFSSINLLLLVVFGTRVRQHLSLSTPSELTLFNPHEAQLLIRRAECFRARENANKYNPFTQGVKRMILFLLTTSNQIFWPRQRSRSLDAWLTLDSFCLRLRIRRLRSFLC
jgi:hypothetical protein